MEHNNISHIVNSRACTACTSCLCSCPLGAISLDTDAFGFMYPHIDESICTQCGVCLSKCHIASTDKPNAYTPLSAYVAYTRNHQRSMRSASGGGFISIASAFVETYGGVGFGCEMDEAFKVFHTWTDSVNELEKYQGSKYVQSNLRGCYQQVREFLRMGRKVLFSGLPCQIAGLKTFIGKDSDADLYTIELICHGVPSNMVFHNYVRHIEKRHGKRLVALRFRNRNAVHRSGFVVRYTFADGQKKNIVSGRELFLTLYGKGLMNRESCYQCVYAKKQRIADITLGDCASRTMTRGPFPYEPVSTILVNTERGKELFALVGDTMAFTEMDYEKEAAKNGQLSAPSMRPVDRDSVAAMMAENNFDALYERYPSHAKRALPIPYKAKIMLYKLLGKYSNQL